MAKCTIKPLWNTADGRELTVKQMTLKHLTNARDCLARRVNDLREKVDICFSYYPNCQGEMAQYYADTEWNRNIDQAQSELQSTLEWIKRFNDEITYRHPKSCAEHNRKGIGIEYRNLCEIYEALLRVAKNDTAGTLEMRRLLYGIADDLESLIGE